MSNLSRTLLIRNKLGLHARAATKLALLSKEYDAEVTLTHQGKSASASSVMGLMLLQTCQGQEVQVSAAGADAQAALDAVEGLINNYFDEGE